MPGISGDHDRETGDCLHKAYSPVEMPYTEQLIQVQWLLEKVKYKVQWESTAKGFKESEVKGSGKLSLKKENKLKLPWKRDGIGERGGYPGKWTSIWSETTGEN